MKSFSLIEILIYSVLVSIILLTAFQIFSPIQDTAKFSESQSEFERNFNFIENTLSYWIRQADSVININPTYLELAMSDISNNPTKFRLLGDNLEISQGSPDNWQVLNSSNVKVSRLLFEKIEVSPYPPLISFEIELKGKIKGKEITRTIKSTVGLRK
ncbi:hypothetical protein J7J41_00435 [bacterium]|nr:hypothetical protein [bacterium]